MLSRSDLIISTDYSLKEGYEKFNNHLTPLSKRELLLIYGNHSSVCKMNSRLTVELVDENMRRRLFAKSTTGVKA